MTNHTFTPREDGSLLMVSRGGRVWISCQETIKGTSKNTVDCQERKLRQRSDRAAGFLWMGPVGFLAGTSGVLRPVP